MGLTPDLLNENCNSITSWGSSDAINGESQLNPAGQFEFATNTHAASNSAERHIYNLSS